MGEMRFSVRRTRAGLDKVTEAGRPKVSLFCARRKVLPDVAKPQAEEPVGREDKEKGPRHICLRAF